MLVMIIEVEVWIVMTYRGKGQNPCWFHSLIHILKKKSQYVIASSLLVLPICSTDYFNY